MKSATADTMRAHPRRYEIVVIAASRGGISALSTLLAALPADFPIPVAIVLHRGPRLPNYQALVLGRHSRIAVRLARPSDPLRPHTVYLASPGRHLVVQPDHKFALVDGRKIQHLSCSANPLFTSAAEVFGPHVLALVLTGGGRDATDGVQSVKQHGGTVIAQDQQTSEDFSMPGSAIQTGAVDQVLSIGQIAAMLNSLAPLTTTRITSIAA